jgi:glycosyltransferase involved in cell wall biosynthesis
LNTNPFFSVIIPTYNRADLIQKTLKSVFEQSYRNFEIIVVDNGSTDNTIEVLNAVEKLHEIRIVRNEVNQERSVSRNLGMKAARGEYLTFLDSDDLMYPDNLMSAYHFLQKNPDAHFFHNLYHLVDHNGVVLYNYHFPSLKDQIKALCWGNFLSCIGVFISNDIYKHYSFDDNPGIIGSEDWEFWLRIASKYELKRINQINSAIVHHSQRSITAFAASSIIDRTEYIIDKFSGDKLLKDTYEAYFSKLRISALLLAASFSNSAGQFSNAKKYLSAAVNIDFKTIFSLKFLRILQIAVFKLKKKSGI